MEVGKQPSQRSVTEKWTMRRTREGNLEVESVLRIEENHSVVSMNLLLLLTPQLHPLKATLSEAGRGDLIFEFNEKVFQIKGRKQAKLEIESPYDLFLPTPWFLGSIVRRAKLEMGKTTKTKLILMDGESYDPRIALMPHEGTVQYLGPEDLSIGKYQINTHKFELDTKALPWTLLVWITDEGIVVAYEDSRSGQRMTLKNYQKHARF